MLARDDITRIQNQLGKLAIASVAVDLEGFIEVAEAVGSPQALAAGIGTREVESASQWAELARLLRPFREASRQRLTIIRDELAEQDENLVTREARCPGCGERRVDNLSINDDHSVLCTTCGRRYQLPSGGAN